MSESRELREFQEIYTPGTLLGVFAAALRSGVDGRVVLAKGIYQASSSPRMYGEYYYDSVRSVHENKAIKARIPALLRNDLQNGQVYTFRGYIEKKVSFSTIELTLVVDQVLDQEDPGITDEDRRRLGLMHRRLSKGIRDLEALVKERIYKNEKVRIINIYGNSAIVHKDFEKGLAEARARFDIEEHRCSLTSKRDIIQSLHAFSGAGFDVVALVRGGGDAASLDIFNDADVGEAGLDLAPLFVTALGHTVNETLCDKLADRCFALPHDYGTTLRQWVEAATEEQARSRSVFIEQVKADLNKTYSDQINTLQKQLENSTRELKETRENFKALLEQAQKDKADTMNSQSEAFRKQIESIEQMLKSREEAAASAARRLEEIEKERAIFQKKMGTLTRTRDLLLLLALCATAAAVVLLLR